MLGVAGFQSSRAHARGQLPLTGPEVGLFPLSLPHCEGVLMGRWPLAVEVYFLESYPRVTQSQPS